MSDADFYSGDNTRHMLLPNSSPARTRSKPPLVISRGEGCLVEDIHGQRYLDAMGGLWCVNVGHGRSEVKAAIAAQLDKLEYFNSFRDFTNEPSIELSAKLIEILAPEEMARVMFASGGSDSVETAIKLARHYWRLCGAPERRHFISLEHGYHGQHFGGISLAAYDVQAKNLHPLLDGFSQIESPFPYRNPWNATGEELGKLVAAQLERTIERLGPDKVAAFVAEPIQGAGGVIVPPDNFWPLIRAICDRHGVLLIADEVVTGFGRSGSLFGTRGYGVKADIMCFAKALTAGYVPLGATAVNRRIAAVLESKEGPEATLFHGYTYSAHPVACAAAIAVLDLTLKEKLPENAANVGRHLLMRLQSLEQYQPVGEVRGKGLMIGIDLVIDKTTREPVHPGQGLAETIAIAAQQRGVLVRAVGSNLIISPPLTFTEADVEQLATVLHGAFEEVTRRARRAPRRVGAI